MDTIGTRIAGRRKELGLTQEELAVKLGISAQAVSKWENDISCPDISLLPGLARTLNITADELLSGNTSKVKVVPETKRKSLDELTLRINVYSVEGHKVNINLPMSFVKVCLEIGVDIAPDFSGGRMKELDLGKILELAEQGLVGKLVEVKSAGGDMVEVVVE